MQIFKSMQGILACLAIFTFIFTSTASAETSYDKLPQEQKVKKAELIYSDIEPYVDIKAFVKVTLNNGSRLHYSNYALDYPKTSSPGFYKIRIDFKNNYQGKSQEVLNYRILPAKPHVNVSRVYKNSIVFNTYEHKYRVKIQYSTNPNMKNPKSVILTPKSGQVKITGLKKATKYYFKFYGYTTAKSYNGKTAGLVSLDYEYVIAPTTGSFPKTSKSNQITKTILSHADKKDHMLILPYGFKYSNKTSLYLDKLCSKYYKLNGYTLSYNANGNVYIVYMEYNRNKDIQKQKAIKVAKKIAKSSMKYKNKTKRALYINKRIAKICHNSHYSGETTGTEYSCLVKGKARCEGYAKAYFLCAKYAKIPVRYRLSVAKSYMGQKNVPHLSNVVKVKGKWRPLDPTNNSVNHSYKFKNYYSKVADY